MVTSKLTSQKEIEDKIKGFEAELASHVEKHNAFVIDAQKRLDEYVKTTQAQIAEGQATALRLEGTINGLKALLSPPAKEKAKGGERNGSKPVTNRQRNFRR